MANKIPVSRDVNASDIQRAHVIHESTKLYDVIEAARVREFVPEKFYQILYDGYNGCLVLTKDDQLAGYIISKHEEDDDSINYMLLGVMKDPAKIARESAREIQESLSAEGYGSILEFESSVFLDIYKPQKSIDTPILFGLSKRTEKQPVLTVGKLWLDDEERQARLLERWVFDGFSEAEYKNSSEAIRKIAEKRNIELISKFT